MANFGYILLFVVVFSFLRPLAASDGDADPIYILEFSPMLLMADSAIIGCLKRLKADGATIQYKNGIVNCSKPATTILPSGSTRLILCNRVGRGCVEQCEKTGCVGDICFQHCKFSSDGKPLDGPWYMHEPLYLRWKQWDCRTDCRYHCMLAREEEKTKAGEKPVKYHGKWPFRRIYGIQEPVAVALSALNLAMQFHGWVSFFILVYYKLPLRPDKKTYYEYAGLWHIYGILSMNSWLWSAVFHSRAVELTEKLNYSSAVALLGFSLILAILRAFNVRDEATRVMISAPLIAFVTTHIMYLNFYELNYGLNTKVCILMAVVELLIWAIWAGVSSHPARQKLWTVVVGGSLAMFLHLYDFPPYMGYADSHALWNAANIPLTFLWWSYVRDDAEFRTSALLKKVK